MTFSSLENLRENITERTFNLIKIDQSFRQLTSDEFFKEHFKVLNLDIGDIKASMIYIPNHALPLSNDWPHCRENEYCSKIDLCFIFKVYNSKVRILIRKFCLSSINPDITPRKIRILENIDLAEVLNNESRYPGVPQIIINNINLFA